MQGSKTTGTASGVYLLLGPENGQKQEFLDQIRKKLTGAAGEKPEEYRYYPFKTEFQEVVSTLRNTSLFSKHRMVLLNHAHEVKNRADCEIIAEYIQKPANDATLILLSDQYQIDKRIDSAVPKDRRKVFWELFDNQKRSWITSFFRSVGITITPEAVELLLELVENDTHELKQVCDRLALFLKDEEFLTEENVEELVYHSKEESVFSLFEKIASGNLLASLEILQSLELSGLAEPSQLLGGLLWQFRKLLAARRMVDSRYSLEDAYRKLNIRSKKNQRVYAAACETYATSQLESILSLFSEYETQLRSNSGNIQDIYLKLFLYDIVMKKGDTALFTDDSLNLY